MKRGKRAVRWTAALCALLCLPLLLALAAHVGAGDGETAGSSAAAEPAAAFERQLNNRIADTLSRLPLLPVTIKKVYALSEDTVVAPKPNPAGYGLSWDGADTRPILAAAEKLLDGETLLWRPELERMPGTPVRWYRDESILALAWKEVVGGDAAFSFTEVKLAHPSQFRRYLADNSFASPIQYPPSQLAGTVQAVCAMNGDFYKFRSMGTVVYNRRLYRMDDGRLDTCYVDARGDFHFFRAGTQTTAEEVQRYVEDADILFSLAFGPVLIDGGVDLCPETYPVGEVDRSYSRACVCQLGELHYLFVTVNFEGPYAGVGTIRSLTDALLARGVPKAYCLDGGQTSTLIFGGTVFNHVDWGTERAVSDILYCATAIPETEWAGAGEEAAHG